MHENAPGDPNGLSSLQFCRFDNPRCYFTPQGHALPFDYDSLAFGVTALDTFDQTLYCIMYNKLVGMPSYTLFGVKRTSDLASELTVPMMGEFSIFIDYPALQYYKWPDRLVGVTSLEFSPKNVAKVSDFATSNSIVT